jgi:hypothetical protein
VWKESLQPLQVSQECAVIGRIQVIPHNSPSLVDLPRTCPEQDDARVP